MAGELPPDSPETLNYKMEQWAALVHEACRSSASRMGEIVADDIKEKLSEPYPPASEPYRYPHLRTGALRDGVEYNLADAGEGVEVSITSSRLGGDPDVPMKLEYGDPYTNLDPRMYMHQAKEEWMGKGGFLAEDILIPELRNVGR